MHSSIDIIFRSIEGNGTPGLKQRMTAVETTIDVLEKTKKSGLATTISIVSCLAAILALVAMVIIGVRDEKVAEVLDRSGTSSGKKVASQAGI